MKHPMPTKKYIVVELEDNDLNYPSYDTYEEALAFVQETNWKCVIIGPEGIEDHR